MLYTEHVGMNMNRSFVLHNMSACAKCRSGSVQGNL